MSKRQQVLNLKIGLECPATGVGHREHSSGYNGKVRIGLKLGRLIGLFMLGLICGPQKCIKLAT